MNHGQDTSLVMELIAISILLGVITPYNIWPGVFVHVHVAADDNDITEDTLDRRDNLVHNHR